MKNTILFLTLIISASNVIAQSKKETIEILSAGIDSLYIEMKRRDFKHEQETGMTHLQT